MTIDRLSRHGLALVGLRGTGKSTVGRILADRLGWTFADADVELETMSGRSISEFFAEMGEPSFRDLEEAILAELTVQEHAILATGGGVVLRESNRRRLRAFGFVVWLSVEPVRLAERLRADPKTRSGRPALTPAGTLAELADLLEARTPLYREVADVVVDAGERSPESVADAILDVWSPAANRA